MQANSSGLRKGAWTEEEDALLRKCIHTYGLGKWHQVPARAGLNRCRKSCRLRWLNYLRPDINRGDFTSDEVDLIIRLHRLLGNRWCLIAGRLPGRTANDVKNYWNTHLLKKVLARKEVKGDNKNVNIINIRGGKTTPPTSGNVILKPRPRKLSGNPYWLKGKTTCSSGITTSETPKSKDKSCGTDNLVIEDSPPFPTSSLQTDDQAKDNSSGIQYWWENLLFLDKEEQGPTWSFEGGDGGSWPLDHHVTNLFSEELPKPVQQGGKDDGGSNQECQIDSINLSSDHSDLWDLLLSDQPAMQSYDSL